MRYQPTHIRALWQTAILWFEFQAYVQRAWCELLLAGQ